MRKRLGAITHAIATAAAMAGLGVGVALSIAGSQAQSLAGSQARSLAGSQARTGASDRTGSRAGVSECGRDCFLLYSRRVGEGSTMNAVIPQDNGMGGRVGRKTNLAVDAAKLPDGNFSFSLVSQVWQFCGTDAHDFFAPASYVCRHDRDFSVFEAEWSPNGNSTGLCAGVAAANQPGENITLRQCGVSDHTLWIANQTYGTGSGCRGSENFCPWMNASDSNFRAPEVLTLDSSARSPADQLRLDPQNLLADGARKRAWNNQEFAFFWHSGI